MIKKLTSQYLEKVVALRILIFQQMGKITSEQEAHEMFALNRKFLGEQLAQEKLLGYFEEADNEIISIALGLIQSYPPINAIDTGKYAYIFNVCTDEKYRQQGRAARLVQKLIAEYRKLGLNKIVLDANERSMNLYYRLGFVKKDFNMVLDL